MKSILACTTMFALLILTIGCSTENPICGDTICIDGEVFLKSELEDDAVFDTFPSTVSEETLIKLLTVNVGGDFEPIQITGLVDWDFLDADWQYRENRVTYLKKLTLEIEADDGKFGENRVLLVHLNADTVVRDANFIKHVDFLGTETVELTHHIGIAEFRGNIVGAPTK